MRSVPGGRTVYGRRRTFFISGAVWITPPCIQEGGRTGLKCPACSAQVSEIDNRCPSCGAVLKYTKRTYALLSSNGVPSSEHHGRDDTAMVSAAGDSTQHGAVAKSVTRQEGLPRLLEALTRLLRGRRRQERRPLGKANAHLPAELRLVTVLTRAAVDSYGRIPPTVLMPTVLGKLEANDGDLVLAPRGICLTRSCWHRISSYRVWRCEGGDVFVTRPRSASWMDRPSASSKEFLSQYLPTAQDLGPIRSIPYAASMALTCGLDPGELAVYDGRSAVAVADLTLLQCGEDWR